MKEVRGVGRTGTDGEGTADLEGDQQKNLWDSAETE